jgi:hypothetical protein
MTDFDFFKKKRDYDLISINHSQNQSKIKFPSLNNSKKKGANAIRDPPNQGLSTHATKSITSAQRVKHKSINVISSDGE